MKWRQPGLLSTGSQQRGDRIRESLHTYPAGTWGPEATDKLLEQDGFHWWPVNGQDEDSVIWQVNS